MTDARWEAVLAQLEGELARFEAALADPSAAPYVSPVVVPHDLGPVPTDLARRAVALATRYETAVERGEAEHDRIRAELRQLTHGRSSAAHHERPPSGTRVEFTA